MSHSTVVVALPASDFIYCPREEDFAEDVDHALNRVLAPFDENAETERYKAYKEGEPTDYWGYTSLRTATKHLADGTGILPHNPGQNWYGGGTSRKTEQEQRAELTREAELFAMLPKDPTWEDVVRVHRLRFPEDSNDEGIQYDAETGRAFEWSTYPRKKFNERGALVGGARWDWWSLGGRWTGYFQLKKDMRGFAVNGRPGLMTSANTDRLKADAARKGRIDFTAMRQEKMEQAGELWVSFNRVADQYPRTQSWHEFYRQVEANEIDIKEARELYREQPGVQALSEHYKEWGWLDDPYHTLRGDMEAYVALEGRRAVPGWALLTLDGEWRERGRMGLWGMSDATDESEDAYLERADAYLDSLADDVVLALVDVHI